MPNAQINVARRPPAPSTALPMIRSKPSYVPLAWDMEGHMHLLAAHGEGGECLLRLLALASHGSVAVRYARDPPDASDCFGRLTQAAPEACQGFDTIAALLDGLRTDLATGRMGLRLYLAGSERFLWSAIRIAEHFGLCADEIRREHFGSPERAVYCVHCKTITTHVTTNVLACPGCARSLLVRDHYSRRLAAYMGFQVDAESPGAIPPIEYLYT